MQSNTATTKLNWLKVETIATENSLYNSCHFRCTIWFFKKRSLSLCIRLRGLTEASSEALTFPGPEWSASGDGEWQGENVARAMCCILWLVTTVTSEKAKNADKGAQKIQKRENVKTLLVCFFAYFTSNCVEIMNSWKCIVWCFGLNIGPSYCRT